MDVVEGSIHLNNFSVRSKVILFIVSKLDSWARASELGGSRGPLNLRALVEKVARCEISNTLLLDASHTKGLLVFLVELCWQNFDDHVSELLLWVNVGIEVGLAGFDGCKDGFERVSAFLHVALDLPVELDIRGNVEVKSEIKEIQNACIVHGMEAFKDNDGCGLDLLWGVQGSVDVVVDGLLHGLSRLERLDLLVHEVEVVLQRVEGGALGDFAAFAVVQVVVVEANDSREVRDEGVGFPAAWRSESSAEGSDDVSSEDVSESAHECRLSATTIGGNTDDDRCLSVLERHVQRRGRMRRSSKVGRDEGTRREGRGRGQDEGSKSSNELHG